MPAESVNRLARMFQDIKVSQDLTREFHEKMRNNASSSSANSSAAAGGIASPFTDLVSIKILSSGTWLPRSLPKVALVLPPEIEDFIPLVGAPPSTFRSRCVDSASRSHFLMRVISPSRLVR